MSELWLWHVHRGNGVSQHLLILVLRLTRRHFAAHFGRFAANVCVQVIFCAFDPARKLPPAVAEARAKSFVCVRGLFVCTGVRHVIMCSLAQSGVVVLVLGGLLPWCVCR